MVSIIIPTLNEADNLPGTIAAVRATSIEHEILVVDGGSNDRTVDVARDLGARVLHCDVRMRAAQLNLGARSASGEALLFLHADTLLPPTGLGKIISALERKEVAGGAFARRFYPPSLFLQMTCLLAEFRNRTIGWHLGDQAMFTRRDLFFELNGFAEMKRFEDLDFSWRLKERGQLVTLRPPVVTSGRRFRKDGSIQRTLKDFWLTLEYCHERRKEKRKRKLS